MPGVIRLDPCFLTHRKFLRLEKLCPSYGLHLWIGLRAWCQQHATDGKFSADVVEIVQGPAGTKRRRRAFDALLSVGLVTHDEHTFDLHGYLEWADDRRTTEQRRAKWRRQKRTQRSGKGTVSTEDMGGTVHVESADTSTYNGNGNDLKEESPLSNVHRTDPLAYLAGVDPTQREDVNQLRGEWAQAFGYTGHQWRGYGDKDAQTLAEALDTYGVDKCRKVLKRAPHDAMVSGEADERGRKHDSIAYVFGNNDAFNRMLRDAERSAPAERRKRPALEVIAEQKRTGRASS